MVPFREEFLIISSVLCVVEAPADEPWSASSKKRGMETLLSLTSRKFHEE